jgi:uncharacterized protein YbjT (DUF2867 family)
MHRPKNILLLGATGRTGRHILDIALERGFTVRVLVRNAEKIGVQNPNLSIFEGDTRNPSVLSEAMDGVEAVLSCLNISRKSDFPWSRLRTPGDFLSDTMKNILFVAKAKGVRRLVVTSAWGVAESRPFIPGWFAWLIDNSNISAAYLEHERQEALVKASDMDWTIVRPVGLTNSSSPKPIRVFLENDGNPSLVISRRNTAGFLLDTLETGKYIRQVPVISH